MIKGLRGIEVEFKKTGRNIVVWCRCIWCADLLRNGRERRGKRNYCETICLLRNVSRRGEEGNSERKGRGRELWEKGERKGIIVRERGEEGNSERKGRKGTLRRMKIAWSWRAWCFRSARISWRLRSWLALHPHAVRRNNTRVAPNMIKSNDWNIKRLE